MAGTTGGTRRTKVVHKGVGNTYSDDELDCFGGQMKLFSVRA